MSKKPIWHRLPKEPVEAFEAFTAYLMMPVKKQTMKWFCEEHEEFGSKAEVKKLEKAYDWKDRAEAFHTDRLTNNLLKETFHKTEVLNYSIMLDQNMRSRTSLAWKLEGIVARRLAKLIMVDPETNEVEADRIPVKVLSQLIQSMGNLMNDTEDKVAEYLGVEELVQFMDAHVEDPGKDESK